jgi:hypothetical protein
VIVDDDGEVIGGVAVRFKEDEVLDLVVLEDDVSPASSFA